MPNYYLTSSPVAATKSSKQNEKIFVGVAKAKKGNLKVYLEELGSVTPRSTVTVHSRVEGQLMRILFGEGDLVKEGDLIAELDASPYRAQLMQAQGQLKKDQALLKEAQVKLERYKILLAQDTIAKQEFDTQESLVSQYEGATLTDQGQIESANVQIKYTQITAPINGRIGLRQVDLGNIVHVSDQNGIATITELQPITVIFSVPEDNIPNILKRVQNKEKLLVLALDREGGHILSVGFLTALDSQVDTATGTIKCKAEFTNKNLALFPNQFVNVKLLLGIKRDAVLIPDSAIQHGSKGPFVFRVKEDNTVTIQPVQPGPAEGRVVSIDNGIKEGETVVVDGVDTLREGSPIEVALTLDNSKSTEINPNEKIIKKQEKESKGEERNTPHNKP